MKEQMPIAEQIKRFEKMKKDFFGEYYDPSMTLMENGDALIERNMQIEEIYEILVSHCEEDCKQCKHNQYWDMCIPHSKAEAIYNADYRKQKEGEWIKHAASYECTACKEEFYVDGYAEDYDPISEWDLHFCPNCGAHMKGGAE